MFLLFVVLLTWHFKISYRICKKHAVLIAITLFLYIPNGSQEMSHDCFKAGLGYSKLICFSPVTSQNLRSPYFSTCTTEINQIHFQVKMYRTAASESMLCFTNCHPPPSTPQYHTGDLCFVQSTSFLFKRVQLVEKEAHWNGSFLSCNLKPFTCEHTPHIRLQHKFQVINFKNWRMSEKKKTCYLINCV